MSENVSENVVFDDWAAVSKVKQMKTRDSLGFHNKQTLFEEKASCGKVTNENQNEWFRLRYCSSLHVLAVLQRVVCTCSVECSVTYPR